MVRYHSGSIVKKAVDTAIQRADELTEIFAIYHKNGKCKLDRQLIKGVRKAFKRFSPYHLARNQAIGKLWSLRDVLQIVHPKPVDDAQSQCFKQILEKTLPFPESWQTELSAGKDKKEVFTRLILEKKLGSLDVLRNLRNMVDSGVDIDLVRGAVNSTNTKGILPFRYVAAARACPRLEPELDVKMLQSVALLPKLNGVTVVIGDISGSMDSGLSNKSDMTRLDAACALSAILRSCCEEPIIFATSGNDSRRKAETDFIPNRTGMALIDAIAKMRDKLGGGGIFLKQVMDFVDSNVNVAIDRIVVITDEQDCANSGEDMPSNAKILGKRNYMINVASSKNGIGYGKWTHIDGFSENVIRWIYEFEKQTVAK